MYVIIFTALMTFLQHLITYRGWDFMNFQNMTLGVFVEKIFCRLHFLPHFLQRKTCVSLKCYWVFLDLIDNIGTGGKHFPIPMVTEIDMLVGPKECFTKARAIIRPRHNIHIYSIVIINAIIFFIRIYVCVFPFAFGSRILTLTETKPSLNARGSSQ